jgi:tetratricopeptide (TPR) repeat protein
MFPVVILLYSWWRHGRVGRDEVKASLPFFAVSLLLGIVTIVFQSHRAIAGEDLHLGGWLWRLGSAGMAVVFYFFKSILPVGLMPIYPDWGEKHIWLQPTVCWCLISIGAVLLCRTRGAWRRHALFGIGFFLINLLPVLGFVPMSYLRITRVADHLCYLPLVGLIALAAAWAGGRMARVIAACALGLVFALASRNYAAVFSEPLSYWTYAAKRNPDAWIAQNDLGNALVDVGRVPEATVCYRRAVELNPSYAEAHNNLGNMLLNQGRVGEALRHYFEALRIAPTYATPQNGIGLALLRTGHAAESIRHFQLALRSGIDFPEAHYNLGLALEKTGRLPEAIEQYRQALQLRSDYPEVRRDLARLEARMR